MASLLRHCCETFGTAVRRRLKVRRTQPAAYCKFLTLLCPRDVKIEHSGGVKSMTDEQLEAGIESIKAMLAVARWVTGPS